MGRLGRRFVEWGVGGVLGAGVFRCRTSRSLGWGRGSVGGGGGGVRGGWGVAGWWLHRRHGEAREVFEVWSAARRAPSAGARSTTSRRRLAANPATWMGRGERQHVRRRRQGDRRVAATRITVRRPRCTRWPRAASCVAPGHLRRPIVGGRDDLGPASRAGAISVAAVFSPMPATPGSPSDGSPRSSASSA